TLFPKDRSHGYPAEMDFAHLAVREDLPDLLKDDAIRIRNDIEGFCVRFLPHYRQEMTLEDSRFDAWLPWYAKYFPRELNSLAGRLRLAALKADSPLYTLFELKWILREPTQITLSTLNAAFQATALRFFADEERTPNQVILELWPIAL